jgi:hypothetical protein
MVVSPSTIKAQTGRFIRPHSAYFPIQHNAIGGWELHAVQYPPEPYLPDALVKVCNPPQVESGDYIDIEMELLLWRRKDVSLATKQSSSVIDSLARGSHMGTSARRHWKNKIVREEGVVRWWPIHSQESQNSMAATSRCQAANPPDVLRGWRRGVSSSATRNDTGGSVPLLPMMRVDDEQMSTFLIHAGALDGASTSIHIEAIDTRWRPNCPEAGTIRTSSM